MSAAVLIRSSGIKESLYGIRQALRDLLADDLIRVVTPPATSELVKGGATGVIACPTEYCLTPLGMSVLGVQDKNDTLKLHEHKRLSTARAKEKTFVENQNRVYEYMKTMDTYPSTLVLAIHFDFTVTYAHAILYALVTAGVVKPMNLLWVPVGAIQK